MCWSHWKEFCGISIHAPRGGSDPICQPHFPSFFDFNPRSPWGERLPMQGLRCRRSLNFNPRSPWGERRLFPLMFILTLLFQSTLPVGGATTRSSNRRTTSRISIHAPRGGSDNNQFEVRCQDYISIHAPRGGSDTVRSIWPQPRSISIHAPRGGSDFLFLHLLPIITNFNPRSPWGERHLHRPLRDYQQGFQSTLPVGGATLCSVPAVLDTLISIHAPRGGSDNVSDEIKSVNGIFQSTLPVGGATWRSP